MIKSGFKNIVLMGDHGGGQKELGEVANKLDEQYSSQGIRVVFCDEVYRKANGDFDKWLAANGYPSSSHAGDRRGLPRSARVPLVAAGYNRKPGAGPAAPEPAQRSLLPRGRSAQQAAFRDSWVAPSEPFDTTAILVPHR